MKPVTTLVSLLLVIVSLAHLVRLVLDVPITVDGLEVPTWLSVIGFAAPLALAWLLWRENRPLGKGN
ncbi:MAG TPA: hypothetical protein PK836_09010 [Syntrophales bacterium]|nr:hypothetical protein [Syntrophales bacterium]HOM07793.1 hypothetical protein [Syntrophales bacterium]HOO00485.1 hypothetical protein [Syntrophales bacterium]HPC01804.1 hypothetical protein [Syntrophales bacterium]HPQ07285.1 hypothetical protein [Syntrophales bacterium]